MKIKIHRGFRAVLSLLVTVMLLVGVMPLSATQVRAETTYFTVYFCKSMCGSWGGMSPHIFARHDEGNNKTVLANLEEMDYLGDEVFLATGYYIHSYTFEINSDNDIPNRMNFTVNANWDISTQNITGADVKNGYLYYTTSETGGKRDWASMPYTSALYRPLSTIPTRSKDTSVATTNVPIDETDNNSTVYKDAVVYDYYSDYELNNVNKTKSQIDSATGGTYWCANLHTTEGYKWESALKYIPNLTLNKKLSDYYNAITDKSSLYPIYFGNLVEHGSGNFNFVDFNNKLATSSNNLWYNNRRELYYANSGLGRDTGSGNNETWTSGSSNNGKVAAQGLYGSQLSASGDLLLSDNTTVAPFFDASWLTNNKVGADYSVKFPFFKVAHGTYNDVLGNSGAIVADLNNEYWEYNSDNSSYAVRMTYSSADQKYHLKQTNQVVYSVKSEGIQNGQNDQGTHYGFYPFDDPISETEHGKYIDKLNYNFGFEVTIPFTLPSYGTIDGTSGGTPITFEFEGDDDLVVYVDDYLALDIGGDHGAVAGMINFKTMTSTVSSVKSGDDKQDNASTNLSTVYSGALSRIRDGGIHTMKIFCMERGLFESNVRIRYNLPGVEEHKLKVEENVVLGTINENLYKLAGNTSNTSTITSNINANLKKVKFKMGLQFGESDTGTFGGYVSNGNATLENTAMTDNGMSGYYFNVTSTGTTNPMTYFNYFPKNSEYYIKISEIDNAHVYKGDTDTGKIVSDLFTCRWDFYKLDNSTATNTGTGFGPAKTTNTSSRPQRIVKTTSTSADNSTNSFKLEGTRATPDRVVFTNTFNKTSFQIHKTISGRNSNDTNQALTFKFKITFDNLGGLGLEDDPTNGSNVQIEPMVVTITIPVGADSGDSTAITDIPVGTSYTIIEISDETTTLGYTSNIPNGGTGTVTETDTTNHICVVGVGNTPNNPPTQVSTFKIRVQSYFTQNNSAQVSGTPGSIKLKLQKSIDGGSNWEVVESDITISPVQTDDTNGRKYFEMLLNEDFEYNTNHKYRILEYDIGGTNTIPSGGYNSVFTSLSEEFTNNSDTKKANRAVSEAVSEEIGGNQTPVLTLSLLNAGTVPIALKIQKVWGTTTVYPTSVKFTVERSTDGSHWENVSHANIVGFDGSVSYDANGKLVLTSANEKIITSGGATITLWGAYIFDTSNVDVDSSGNIYQYKITEYTSSDVQVDDGSIFYFTTGSGDNAQTTMFSVSYHPAAFAPGYLNSYSGQTEAAADYLATISDYESTYGDTTAHTMRVVPLSIINSPVPDPDAPATGGRGGYVPIAGGFIAILLAGAGYFIYKKRIFA